MRAAKVPRREAPPPSREGSSSDYRGLGWGGVSGFFAIVAFALIASCAREDRDEVRISFPMSSLGAEAELVREQLTRFMASHPGIVVEPLDTPDAADERHQLYVQWLNAGVAHPDVLQLDVIWIAEFASAGWILPLAPSDDDFFPNVLAAAAYEGENWGVPWFVDVAMLFRGQYRVPWGQILAAAVVATLPVVALVLAFQRRIVRGLTAGAVKG